MINIDKELFTKHLVMTQKWVEHISIGFNMNYGSYGRIFRQFNPIINGKELYSFEDGYTTWNIDNYDISNYKEALSMALSERKGDYDDIKIGHGRVLGFTIGWTTHDGIAIAESNCFMDESDVPPIDTWFYLAENVESFYNKSVLFCWIPLKFESVVNKAMEVEMMRSYFWFDEIL